MGRNWYCAVPVETPVPVVVAQAYLFVHVVSVSMRCGVSGMLVVSIF